MRFIFLSFSPADIYLENHFIFLKKTGVIDTTSLRYFANLLVGQMKSPFRCYDHLGSDHWNDYTLKGEKVQPVMIS